MERGFAAHFCKLEIDFVPPRSKQRRESFLAADFCNQVESTRQGVHRRKLLDVGKDVKKSKTLIVSTSDEFAGPNLSFFRYAPGSAHSGHWGAKIVVSSFSFRAKNKDQALPTLNFRPVLTFLEGPRKV